MDGIRWAKHQNSTASALVDSPVSESCSSSNESYKLNWFLRLAGLLPRTIVTAPLAAISVTALW